MDSDCLFCQNTFESYSINNYSNWDLQLFRDDQYYLGRTVIVFTDRHIEDITELSIEERNELFEIIIPELHTALEQTFRPDLYNYTSLGNDCRHLHIHVIPRYKEKREYNGKIFKDEYWNQTYSQDYDPVKLDSETYQNMIQLLQNHLP